jgi:stage II sporulation protein D
MTIFHLKKIAAFLLITAALSCLPRVSDAAQKSPEVRILVEDSQELMRLEIRGDYRILLLPSLEEAKKGTKLLKSPVTAVRGGFRIGDQSWTAQGIRVETPGGRQIYLDDTRFRGTLDIKKDAAGKLFAVNRLGVEDYLYGVLQHEVPHWWPMEALKAQAVAARTYALYQKQVNKALDYDLKSGTSSQMYGGSTTERYRTKAAVDQTRGEALVYQGKIFPAYFHATCAGVTAGAQELWKINLPPLSGLVHCGYCRISPHYFWQASIPLSTIEEKLKNSGRVTGQIIKIEAVTQTPSGRVGSLRITGISGEAVIAAKDFRVWVGGDKMKSTLFTISLVEDMAQVHGKGWGHGVGLCQWGTLGQALLGRRYKEILSLYYAGSEIQKDDISQ